MSIMHNFRSSIPKKSAISAAGTRHKRVKIFIFKKSQGFYVVENLQIPSFTSVNTPKKEKFEIKIFKRF